VLTSVYAAANHDLTGWHFLVAILFGGGTLGLVVEAFYRSQAQVPWLSIGLTGALCAVVSLTFVALPANHQATASEGRAQAGDGAPAGGAEGEAPAPAVGGNRAGGGLSFSARPLGRELFRLAFYKPITLPRPKETADQLRQRGGIEVGAGDFRILLGNTSSEPIAVLSVRVEVLGSKPRPEGALAYQFSQGAEGVAQLGATITQTRPGATVRLYESAAASGVGGKKSAPSYFATNFIHLEPGEVNPLALTVHAEPHRLVRFRFVAEGSSARHHFVERTPSYGLVGGIGLPEERYERVYVDGQFPGVCTATPESPWYDERLSWGTGGTSCPEGAEGPREIPLSDPAAYPPGRFHLDLNLGAGRQSAAIDGVGLGTLPAAQPKGSAALPLLRALGAWSTCVDRWPLPGYWTAIWEKWGLFLVFSGDDARNCTPQSSSSVRQIELVDRGQVVHTNRGDVAIGTNTAAVPRGIREAATDEGGSDEPQLVVPGVSPCDPVVPAERPQVLPERSGGILALDLGEPRSDNAAGEEVRSREVDGAITTLPGDEC
jgi:hypothetical protein